MKSVIMAIQPYWVFLIIAKAMGWNYPKEKTVEVRKTFPKDEEWNKSVKIYCSKNKKSFNRIPKEFQPLMEKFLGKIIGEFICDKIEGFAYRVQTPEDATSWLDCYYGYDYDFVCADEHCLTADELYDYGNKKMLFGWHISDLIVYDKPKELYEFKAFCNSYWEGDKCDDCKYFIDGDCYEYDESDCGCNGFKPLERPPQSWCYVEGVTV